MPLPDWFTGIVAPVCGSTLIYGYVQESHALIPVNSVGILFSLWYIVMYYSACDSKQRKMIEIVLLTEHSMGLLWTAIAYYALPYEARDVPMGVACNVPNIAFYAAPLLSIVKVVKTRSTASLSLPTTAASFACAVFWAVFGVGENDAFIYVPNGLGVLFSGLQLVCFLIYNVILKSSDAKTAYSRQQDLPDFTSQGPDVTVTETDTESSKDRYAVI